jgi:transcriptional regulator
MAPADWFMGPRKLLGILRDYVAFYEGSLPEPWRFDHETEFAGRMAAQVVGFRVEVSRWEGKWKLAQNHPVARRRRTIAALESQPSHDARQIADLMRATLPEKST